MKIFLLFILVFTWVLCLVGCGETDKYSVTVKNNYPIAGNLEQTYHAGEKVTSATKNGSTANVTRYMIMSFTDGKNMLGCLEMAVIERYDLS